MRCFCYIALAVAAHLAQLVPAATNLEDLDGFWQSATGTTVVEIAPGPDRVRTGKIVRVSGGDKSRGYSLGDVVFHDITVSGTNISFTLTVRADDPKLRTICPATSVAYSATLSDDLSVLSGSFDNGEFQTLTDDVGNPIACRFVALPGKLAANYKRIYLPTLNIIPLHGEAISSITLVPPCTEFYFEIDYGQLPYPEENSIQVSMEGVGDAIDISLERTEEDEGRYRSDLMGNHFWWQYLADLNDLPAPPPNPDIAATTWNDLKTWALTNLDSVIKGLFEKIKALQLERSLTSNRKEKFTRSAQIALLLHQLKDLARAY